MHVLFTSLLEPVKDKLPLDTVQRRITCVDVLAVDGDKPPEEAGEVSRRRPASLQPCSAQTVLSVEVLTSSHPCQPQLPSPRVYVPVAHLAASVSRVWMLAVHNRRGDGKGRLSVRERGGVEILLDLVLHVLP